MSNFPGTGIFDMPSTEYFGTEAASNSGLKLIARSPAHYQASRTASSEPTAAQLMGTAIHTAVLEPETFASRYVVLPEDRPKRPSAAQLNAKKPSAESLAAIDWWAAFNASNEGKEIIDSDTLMQVTAIADSVRNHPVAGALLATGKPEQSAFWIDEDTGADCKARFDWLGAGIVDLKTTTDAGAEMFARDAFKWRYHCQAAIYQDAYRAITGEYPEFKFIVVEKDPPYAVAVYTLHSDSVELGRRTYKRDLATYQWCVETGSWPGYPAGVQELELPRWAFMREQD